MNRETITVQSGGVRWVALLALFLGAAFSTFSPPAMAYPDKPQILIYGPVDPFAGRARAKLADYPTVVTDARRAFHRITSRPFEKYHICDVRPDRIPVYCLTGQPVDGYWPDTTGRTYVVVYWSHYDWIQNRRSVASYP